MSSGGGQTSTNTIQNSAPWSGSQPYLTDLMSQAQGLYNKGSSYAPFSTVAPLSDTTQLGLDLTQQRAINGSPVVNAANNAVMNLVQPQSTPGQDALKGLLSGYNDPGSALTQQATQANPYAGLTQSQIGQRNAALPQAQQMAQSGPSTNPTNVNPYLDSMFKAASNPVIDAVQAQFGLGGRTGSVADQQALTRNLGDLAANIYGSNYNQAVNNNINAYNSQNNAVANAGNLSANDLNRNVSLTSLLGGMGQNQLTNLLNAGGQLSQNALNQANFRAGTATSLNNAQNTQAGQSIAAATLAPTLANQDYTDLNNLLNVGTAYQNQNQANISDLLNRYNYTQTQPWNLLNNYAGVVSGLGSLGGSTSGTSTGTQPSQSIVPGLLGAGVSLLGAPTSSGGSLFSSLLDL
jgi:hypothetical protein